MVSLLIALMAAAVPGPVHGDFDHDGKRDVARLIMTPRGGYDLVVRRGANGHAIAHVEHFKDLTKLYLSTARPGRWRTWCGKAGECDGDPRRRQWVRLRGDTLSFGREESSESVAIWNGRRFEVVLLSD